MVCFQVLSPFVHKVYGTRKDLADSGAHHFAETIRKIKQKYAACLPCGHRPLLIPRFNSGLREL
jgi:lipoate synthase